MIPGPKPVNPLCKEESQVLYMRRFTQNQNLPPSDVPTDISRAPKPRTDRPARQQITELPKVRSHIYFLGERELRLLFLSLSLLPLCLGVSRQCGG